jgi:hypothetical protein
VIIDGFVVPLACWAFCFRVLKMIVAFVFNFFITPKLVSTLKRCISLRVL